MTRILLGRVLVRMQEMHAREASNYKEEPPEDIDCSLCADADARDANDCIAGLHDHSAEAEFLEMYKKH